MAGSAEGERVSTSKRSIMLLGVRPRATAG
jgi:hypothetical protein